ncbi:MAG: AlpA family phage regulatory protein [Gammaproteobacteria bacterium]|nr:AlpA family phage regulatory protein [Gammaproteobacteria bacterium]
MQDTITELLRPAECAVYLGMSRSRLWKLTETDPTFPKKIVLSPRCVGWRKTAIDEWLRKKEQAAA